MLKYIQTLGDGSGSGILFQAEEATLSQSIVWEERSPRNCHDRENQDGLGCLGTKQKRVSP